MNITEPFIRRPVATTLLMSALAFSGIVALSLLPVAPLPQIDFPTIQVTATLAGASPETMAATVAAPLERQLGQIAGLSQMTSFSALGATSITIQFDLDRNIDAAAQDVQAAITAAGKSLPQAMTAPPIYRKLNPAETPILVLSVRSDGLPLPVINEYADNLIAQPISQMPGVAQVAIGGEQQPAIRVRVDPAALAARGLTFEDVRNAIVNATTDAAKGALTTPKRAYAIAANDQITEPPQYDDVVICYRNGAPVRVGDVGRAVAAAADRGSAAFPDNRPGLLLSVSKESGANVIATVERIRARLPSLLVGIPAAIKVEILLDRTATIWASVRDVEFTLALTAGLVVLVVLVSLLDIRATAIVGAVVALSLFGAFAAMYVLRFSLDNISLMGLAIAAGFVVDDAIVVVENIHRYIEKGVAPLAAALAGSREIAFTVLSISLSLVAVFTPLVLMGGIVGRVFREFGLTITAAVAVSAVVSLSLAPMMCSRLIRIAPTGRRRFVGGIEAGFNALLTGYGRTLDVVLAHRPAVLCVFLATLALTVLMAVRMPKGFFPIQDTGVISGLAVAAAGVPPDEMMRLERELGDVIRRDPAIAGFASWTGRTGGNGYAQTANTARFIISLKPRDRRRLTASQIIDRLRPQIAEVPGVSLFLSPAQDITVGARASRGSFQYTLQSADIGELTHWSQKLLAELRGLPQIADAASDLEADAPQIGVKINRDQAARFGITAQLIDDTLDDAYAQRQITQYFTQTNAIPVILEMPLALQRDFSSLDRIYVKSPLSGAVVPLAALVTLDSDELGPLSVPHQGLFPAVTLSFNLRPGVSLGQAVVAVTRTAASLHMPGTMVGAFQGNARAFQASLASMPFLIIGALVAVYIILGILYESYIHPLTILSTLPPAGLGALLALRAAQMDLSVIAVAGLVLLIGIVKKNGIMLVDFAIAAGRDRNVTPLAAIREACLLRLRPILMTTAAALLAGVPLALSGGTGSELRRPLGCVMIGGLLLSQLLTLYTTPVIYLYLDRLRKNAGKPRIKRREQCASGEHGSRLGR